MLLPEARTYIGKKCAIRWRERDGNEQTTIAPLHDVTYVPLYGAFLITDSDDIRLDCVQSLQTINADGGDRSFGAGDRCFATGDPASRGED